MDVEYVDSPDFFTKSEVNQATQLNFEYMCPKMDVEYVDSPLQTSPNSNFEYVCVKMDVENVD